MIPIRHTLPHRTPPVINRMLVVFNIVIFIVMLFLGQRAEAIIDSLGFIPARLMNPTGYGYTRWEVAVTLVTSLFILGVI